MEKFIDKFKKFFSSDESLKRIPTYLFLLCITLIILVVMLFKINSNLELIAENSGNKISPITKDENYDYVLDTFTEDHQTLENIIPYATENDDNTTETNSNNAPTSTQTSKDEITENEKTESPSVQENTVSKTAYVINTSSKKIHFADCTFADRTKEENKKTGILSIDELNNYLNNGYSFCKTCGGN